MAIKKLTCLLALIILVTPSTLSAEEKRKPADPGKPAAEADEKVYTVHEVDIEAELKNLDETLLEFQSKFSCKDPDTDVTLSMVLNKSGKVTDVNVEISTECAIPEKAVEELKKLKFTPAMKANVPVNELFQIQMRLEPAPGK